MSGPDLHKMQRSSGVPIFKTMNRQLGPRIAVLMGVAGCGKTMVGEALARRLGWRFQEGDALHPPANIAKMRSGRPLDDADRAPWLAAIAARIDAWRQAGDAGVVTCSALKRHYRDAIIGNRLGIRLVYLAGERALLAERLAARSGHFMPPSLLDSQLATLEPPGPDEDPLIVSIALPVEAIVERLASELTGSIGEGGTIEARSR